jgi:hypothetical protein
MKPPTTLQDWIDGIKSEQRFVGIKPYSHNIIQLSLQAIAEQYGRSVANKVIDDLELDALGWEKEEL